MGNRKQTKAKANVTDNRSSGNRRRRTYGSNKKVLKEGTAKQIVMEALKRSLRIRVSFDISGATIVDPATSDKTEA